MKVIDSMGFEYFKAVTYLKSQKIIGFDTESRPCFTPHHPHYGTSLLHLSGSGKSSLFRLTKMGCIPKAICKILADPAVVKVGAAVNDDVRGLERLSKFSAQGFVDLQSMVWEYGIKDKSVKKMAAIILGVKISKAQQLSNWEAEELSDAQKAYAATDAWICREMYLKLMNSEKNPLTPEQMMPAPSKITENDKDIPQEG
ncbi:MAG: 3'-5' exonuclease domain-containing protein 2 [Bacteroidales bacterium]|nr:3'-5' exonuclease domain-containing protein 2 [Bacteroidales bacterium]